MRHKNNYRNRSHMCFGMLLQLDFHCRLLLFILEKFLHCAWCTTIHMTLPSFPVNQQTTSSTKHMLKWQSDKAYTFYDYYATIHFYTVAVKKTTLHSAYARRRSAGRGTWVSPSAPRLPWDYRVVNNKGPLCTNPWPPWHFISRRGRSHAFHLIDSVDKEGPCLCINGPQVSG